MPLQRPGHQVIRPGDPHGREDKHHVDNRLPHHPIGGERRLISPQGTDGNKRLQLVDRADADDGHGQLHLEHGGVDVVQPFRLVRVAL